MATQSSIIIRKASEADALGIINLYYQIYQGTYPDPMMSNHLLLFQALTDKNFYWMVAEDEAQSLLSHRIIGSVVYQIDEANLLAKVFGAAVHSEYRGQALTERLMEEGLDEIINKKCKIEVVYATTRTVSSAPQKLTQNLNYKRLGIFPNVHKTGFYETHCLTAKFLGSALQKRFTGFSLHPKLVPFFSIIENECNIPALPTITASLPATETTEEQPNQIDAIDLEVITAKRFIIRRFNDQKINVQEHHWFFPFHEPNLLLTSDDQSIEVFIYRSTVDQHCAIIGIRDTLNRGYGAILQRTCEMLHSIGARYLECIIRADETKKINCALNANLLPCGYFPALQLSAAGYRFDYVVLSRSFETLHFRDLRFEGANKDYLKQYYLYWKEASLGTHA